MLDNALLQELAILTPSRITTEQRRDFASASYTSLEKCLQGATLPHVVVHDSPKSKKTLPKLLHKWVSSVHWDAQAKAIYGSPQLTWLEGDGNGSAGALLKAVDAAIANGQSFGFIHLDDHVYTESFGQLLVKGLSAMAADDNLLWTRFSGYPIMYDGRERLAPNQDDQIVFDGVALSPKRSENYTLWMSSLTSEANSGKYWPVAMWFCIYRLPVLKHMLEWALAHQTKHLAHVEVYFKSRGGFEKLLEAYPNGGFGYINMQFGGIEMHHNRNWPSLLKMSNEEVR